MKPYFLTTTISLVLIAFASLDSLAINWTKESFEKLKSTPHVLRK